MMKVMRDMAAATSLVAVLLLQPAQALAQVARAPAAPAPVALVKAAPVQISPAPAASVQGALVQPAQRPVPVLVLGGAATAAVGMVAFGFVGALIGGNSCADIGNPDSCRGMEGGLWGAAVGYTVGIPAGVHLANGRAGRLGPSLLASAAIAGAGAAIGFGIGTDQSIAVAALSAPIIQMVSSVIIERRTARRRPGG
jgi:hypothetical protein